jgi:transcription initiation factor IIE alpha subunit
MKIVIEMGDYPERILKFLKKKDVYCTTKEISEGTGIAIQRIGIVLRILEKSNQTSVREKGRRYKNIWINEWRAI